MLFGPDMKSESIFQSNPISKSNPDLDNFSAKNVVNILCKNLVEAFLTALAYWFVGYGLSREGKNGFIGGKDFFHVGVEERNSPL